SSPSNIVLEVWTELFSGPRPRKKSSVAMKSRLGLTNEVLHMGGGMRMVLGRAFRTENLLALPGQGHAPNPANDSFLATTYEEIGGRRFVVEAMEWEKIAPQLANLPEPAEALYFDPEKVRAVAQNSPRGSAGRAGMPISI